VGFTEEHTKAISLQIVHGLRDIHNCQIANLDLNPSNILIDEFFGLKITDFSCAHLFDEPLGLGKLGSRQFMSPELVDRSLMVINEDLRQADIWSLGIMLFVL
jgi:serine/threonine protein kinase